MAILVVTKCGVTCLIWVRLEFWALGFCLMPVHFHKPIVFKTQLAVPLSPGWATCFPRDLPRTRQKVGAAFPFHVITHWVGYRILIEFDSPLGFQHFI